MSVLTKPAEENAVDRPEEILGLAENNPRCAQLESFAARQRSLVRTDDTAPLLSLLADRQRLSVELACLARRLNPVRRSWLAVRERFTAGQRTEADGLVSDATQRLRRVIESDEKDARVLSLRKQGVASSLQATHRVGQAISAYRSPAGAAAVTDRLDEAS